MVICSSRRVRPVLLASAWLLARPALAQQPARPDSVAAAPAADTTRPRYQLPGAAPHLPWYRGRVVRATVVPAALIGYGLSVYDDHGFYSSQRARADLQRHFPGFSNHLDDYLQYAPYLELGAVLALGVEGRHDRLNLALLLVKSELLMAGAVEVTKRATHQLRPDGSDYRSFPSGHTAQAFLAASIVHLELRHQSQWYGVGAYAVATSVGALRMLNNKHWEADVFAGAGYGILAAHLAYLSHRHRWGRHPAARASVGQQPPGLQFCWAPVPLPGGLGLQLSWRAP
ncbi:MAG: phosphatase PAP2 family protein [Janthinobacterium lividum]